MHTIIGSETARLQAALTTARAELANHEEAVRALVNLLGRKDARIAQLEAALERSQGRQGKRKPKRRRKKRGR